MRAARPEERLLRAVFADRPTRILNRIVEVAYDRYDGPKAHLYGTRLRRLWGGLGDAADRLRARWLRRPVR